MSVDINIGQFIVDSDKVVYVFLYRDSLNYFYLLTDYGEKTYTIGQIESELDSGALTLLPFGIGSKIILRNAGIIYISGIDYKNKKILVDDNNYLLFSSVESFVNEIKAGNYQVVIDSVFSPKVVRFIEASGSSEISHVYPMYWDVKGAFYVRTVNDETKDVNDVSVSSLLENINKGYAKILPFKTRDKFITGQNKDPQEIKLDPASELINVKWSNTTSQDVTVKEFNTFIKDGAIKVLDDNISSTVSQTVNAITSAQKVIDLSQLEIGHYFIIDDTFYRLRLVNSDLYFFNPSRGNGQVLSLVGDEIIQKHKDNTLYHLPFTQGTIFDSGGSTYIFRDEDDENLIGYELASSSRLFITKSSIKSSLVNNTQLIDVTNNDLFHPRELYTLLEQDVNGNPVTILADKIFKISEIFYNTGLNEFHFSGTQIDGIPRTFSEYALYKQIWDLRRKTLARKDRLFTWGTYPQQNKFEIKYDNSEKLYVPVFTDVQFGVDLDGFFDSIKSGRIKWVEETEKPQAAATPQKPVQSPKPPKKFVMSELDEKRKELNEWIEFKNIMDEVNPEEIVNINTNIYEKSKELGRMLFEKAESELTDNAMLDELFEQSFKDLKRRYDDVYSDDFTDFFAPDGKKSAYSDAINEITRSPQFKDWFGDWEEAYALKGIVNYDLKTSVVTTNDGEPQIVWHGTNNPFAYFKFDQFPAAYFAVNPEYSVWFAEAKDPQGGYVYPFFLNVRNPLDLTIFGIEPVSPTDFFATIFIETGLSKDELNMNPIFLDDNLDPVPIWVYLRNNPSFLQTLRDKNLYDGINFYEFIPNLPPTASNYKTEAWIIFSPESAKLADPERGKLMLSSLKSFILRRGGKI
jgi:hypothetical protein